jgi:hypothetical protein
MTNTNVEFSRRLLAQARETVRARFPEIRIMKDAGLTRCGNCWTFEGPDK